METVISGKDFNLAHTFECGQCFRWNAVRSGEYEGVAGGKAVRLKKRGDEIVIENCSQDDYNSFWKTYFDMERDYAKVKEAVSINPVMKTAVEFGSGIRILRQEFFEALMSYIISQNNSIPNIKRIIECMCAAYGEKISLGEKIVYSFPKPSVLATLTENDFRQLGAGFRDKYLTGAAALVAEGALSYENLCAMPTQQSRAELMKIKGVGNKVCDCVLLFALGKFDLFPTDTWINQVMEESFGTDSVKSAKDAGESLFGEYSGFAQQYLFYWKRQTTLNKKNKTTL